MAEPTDVLIVGAGPTGLTLAAQLKTFGVDFRIIDRTLGRAHESRALAVQARTLEVFESLGIGQALVSRGNASARLALHFEGGTAAKVELGGFAAADTRFPFILFVSQAETEALLAEHLGSAGVIIDRGVELVSATPGENDVRCTLRHADGREEELSARYVVGCDGAHSTVRKQAQISFEGDAYLQDFMLGDLEADGPMEPDTLHAYTAGGSIGMFFPLRTPATWRVIAMSTKGHGGQTLGDDSGEEQALLRGELALSDLQTAVDIATAASIRLRDPVWLAHFRLHHRQARTYRRGRVFLAGDAAHIHSPVGAQGMNTGIQDAWNLGWKLALVVLGRSNERLLDTYQEERWPIGRNLLRYTDRIFSLFMRAMSSNRFAAWMRRAVMAKVLPRLFRSDWVRATAFRFVSELAISYRGRSAVAEAGPRRSGARRAGDRLPDARVIRNGRETYVLRELSGPRFHVLLCGDLKHWDPHAVQELEQSYRSVVAIHYFARSQAPEALVDARGEALARLGVGASGNAVQYVVRPDGYIGARCGGPDLTFISRYLARWLTV